jgi:hypothetical protein
VLVNDTTKGKDMAKRYTEEEKQDLKKISIVDYAKNVLGMSLKRDGKQFTVEGHDSVFISSEENLWNRFSDDSKLAGGDIFTFVQYWENCSFPEALDKLYEHKNGIDRVTVAPTKEKATTSLEMPEKDDNVKNIYAFLIQERGIEPKIVSQWIREGYLYQGKQYKECIFTGSFKGNTMFATKVTTRKNKEGKFDKFDVENSVKEVGIYQNNNTDTIMVFESPIDCMAYQSMKQILGQAVKDVNYLICGGAGTAASSLYFNMVHYGMNIENVILALDNDETGHKAMKTCIDMIKDGIRKGEVNEDVKKLFENVKCSNALSQYKDWNDDLKKMKESSVLESIKAKGTQTEKSVGAKPLDKER